MKQKTRFQPAAGSDDAAVAAVRRADRLNEELAELRESSRKKLAAMAQAGVAREKVMRAVLAVEDGRNLQLARMLHDNVGQQVAALLIGLTVLKKDCGAGGNPRLTLQSLYAIAESIGHELHKMALELRPTSLDDHGLARSLTTFLEEWSIVAKIGVAFDPVSLGADRLPRHIELTMFRIIRDALECVLNAPGATHVSVILKRDHGGVTTIVEDVGARQVAAGEPNSGVGGLAHLTARVALLGGVLTVERTTGGGTTVFARLPLPDAALES